MTFLKIFIIILFVKTSFASQLPFNGEVDDLKYLIKENKVKTLEEELNLISPDFFAPDNYRLIFKSGSPQGATKVSPRVILFGKDDLFRIGFNHKTNRKRALEFIQWRPGEQSWELSEVEFKEGKAHFTKANPGACIGCHDNNKEHEVRPNIEMANKLLNRLNFNGQHSAEFSKNKNTDPIYSKLRTLQLSPSFSLKNKADKPFIK